MTATIYGQSTVLAGVVLYLTRHIHRLMCLVVHAARTTVLLLIYSIPRCQISKISKCIGGEISGGSRGIQRVQVNPPLTPHNSIIRKPHNLIWNRVHVLWLAEVLYCINSSIKKSFNV